MVVRQLDQHGLMKMTTICGRRHQVEPAPTDRVVSCFEEMIQFTQYFELLDHFIKNCDCIKHDSNPDEIFKTLGTELRKKFPFLKEGLVETGILIHTVRLRFLHFAELSYKLGLFIPSCKFLEHSTASRNNDAELIKQTDEFKRNFSEMPDHLIGDGLDEYRFFRDKKCGRDEAEWRSAYEEDLKKKLDYKKNLCLQVINAFQSSVYEMVFQTRKEGYRMDINGDPYAEVSKMEKHYEEIKSANTADNNGKSF